MYVIGNTLHVVKNKEDLEVIMNAVSDLNYDYSNCNNVVNHILDFILSSPYSYNFYNNKLNSSWLERIKKEKIPTFRRYCTTYDVIDLDTGESVRLDFFSIHLLFTFGFDIGNIKFNMYSSFKGDYLPIHINRASFFILKDSNLELSLLSDWAVISSDNIILKSTKEKILNLIKNTDIDIYYSSTLNRRREKALFSELNDKFI